MTNDANFKIRIVKIGLIIVLFALLNLADRTLDPYYLRVLNLCGIYIILGVSLNLIFGFTGQFSLGHAGFMAIGAYVTALLTMTPEQKEATFIIEPIIGPLANLQTSFLTALIAGGLIAALISFFIGAPALRLRGDYLAIATLGFAEIIRIVANNTFSITNGALGLKGIPEYTTIYWSWGCAVVTVVFTRRLVKSSYGRAFMAIREDETAAEAMGVSIFKHKIASFMISSFFAGVGGGLLANLITTIDPKMFFFLLTFNVLIIVVAGGQGSIAGSCIAAVGYTILLELLRALEEPWDIASLHIPGIPGVRMVVFSAALLAVILFRPEGLMGRRELSLTNMMNRLFKHDGKRR